MTAPIWTASFGCPAVDTVTGYLFGYASVGNPPAQLIGFDEFIFSTPRKKYRKYTMSGSVTSHDPSRSPIATYTVAGSGSVSNNYYNADGTTSGSTTNPDLTQTPPGSTYFSWFQLSQPPAVSGTWWTPFAGQDTTTPTSTTQVWAPVPVGVGNTGSGSLTVTLSEEDTPSDAVTRLLTAVTGAGPVSITAGPAPSDFFAAGIFGLWEIATDASGYECQFSYQEGQYDVHYINLAPGQNYHEVVVWEERDASGDGTGDTSAYGSTWTNCHTDSSDFLASATSQSVTGRSVPVASGKQRRIKSINITAI